VTATSGTVLIQSRQPGTSSGSTMLVHSAKALGIHNCFPMPEAVSWMGSGFARIRISIHMGSGSVQGKDFGGQGMLSGL